MRAGNLTTLPLASSLWTRAASQQTRRSRGQRNKGARGRRRQLESANPLETEIAGRARLRGTRASHASPSRTVTTLKLAPSTINTIVSGLLLYKLSTCAFVFFPLWSPYYLLSSSTSTYCSALASGQPVKARDELCRLRALLCDELRRRRLEACTTSTSCSSTTFEAGADTRLPTTPCTGAGHISARCTGCRRSFGPVRAHHGCG